MSCISSDIGSSHWRQSQCCHLGCVVLTVNAFWVPRRELDSLLGLQALADRIIDAGPKIAEGGRTSGIGNVVYFLRHRQLTLAAVAVLSPWLCSPYGECLLGTTSRT